MMVVTVTTKRKGKTIMKILQQLIVLIILGLLLYGCLPTGVTVMPTISETNTPFPTATHSFTTTVTWVRLSTSKPTLTQTATAIPSPSLEPEQAREAIKELLRESIDCAAPCFLGIVPGKTRLGEAINILTHLGLEIKSTKLDNNFFYVIKYESDSGLSIIATLTVTGDIVRSIEIDITPEEQKTGIQREWLAYSPETMIQRYGQPSRVELFLGRGPDTNFVMDVYFDEVDTIIEYFITDLGPNTRICPVRDQFDGINLWMGKNPWYPPLKGIALEKATSLTLDRFAELMTGNPDEACFDLLVDMFP